MATVETEQELQHAEQELKNELRYEGGPEEYGEPPDIPPQQLALPVIDHRDADQVELAVSGTIKLDRKDPADCALIRRLRLRLGDDVDLHVSGLVVERAGRSRHNQERRKAVRGIEIVREATVAGVRDLGAPRR